MSFCHAPTLQKILGPVSNNRVHGLINAAVLVCDAIRETIDAFPFVKYLIADGRWLSMILHADRKRPFRARVNPVDFLLQIFRVCDFRRVQEQVPVLRMEDLENGKLAA